MYVYKIVNKINGKMYIGITAKTINERWLNHVKSSYSNSDYKNKTLIEKSICKYGKENFEIEKIEECSTTEEMRQKEIEYIDYYRTFVGFENCNGYNMTRGGDYDYIDSQSVKVFCYDLESLDVLYEFDSINEAADYFNINSGGISNVCNGKKQSRVGVGWSFLGYLPKKPDYSKCSIPVDLYYSCSHEFYKSFKSLSEASQYSNVNKTSLAKSLRQETYSAGGFVVMNEGLVPEQRFVRTIARKVYKYDLSGNFICEYESLEQASKDNGLKRGWISSVCNGKLKRTGNFMWSFEKKEKITPYQNKKCRTVQKLDKDTEEVLCEYESASQAAREVDGSPSSISGCCNGYYNLTYGFKWKYKLNRELFTPYLIGYSSFSILKFNGESY